MTKNEEITEIKSGIETITKWITKKNKPKSLFSYRWIFYLLILCASLLFAGFLYYRSWRQGKKIAWLLHEKDVNMMRISMKVREQQLQTNEHTIEKLHKKELLLAQGVVKIDKKISKIKSDNKHTNNAISDLRTWRDVDKYISNKKRKRKSK